MTHIFEPGKLLAIPNLPAEPLIAGGSVVAEFLKGWPAPYTGDIDVFFPNVGTDDFHDLVSANRGDAVVLREFDEDDDRLGYGQSIPVNSARVQIGNYDLVCFDHNRRGHAEILNGFDLGINRIGYDPIKALFIFTPEFMRDLHDNKVTIIRPTGPKTRQRAERYAARYGMAVR